MKVNFVRTLIPCVVNEITLWHVQHGMLWDVVEAPSGRYLGVFFCTLLCGDGCIIHFYSLPDVVISPATILYAFRKAVRMMTAYGNVIFATVPESKKKLCRVLCGLGFRILPDGNFIRDDQNILLLKYFPDQNTILNNVAAQQQQTQEAKQT